MIGALSGRVYMVAEDTAIIDVQGVGYEIAATSRFLSGLTHGAPVSCVIETMVREDFIRLYAFASDTERQCFKLLQSVQGVGAKAALSILQVLTPAELLDAIIMEDATSIARAQGVGKKIATRIVTELQGKLPLASSHTGQLPAATATGNAPSLMNSDPGTGLPPAPAAQETEMPSTTATIRADAVSALVNLGYEMHHAREAVKIAHGTTPEATVQALIRLSLKSLALA